MVDVDLGDGNVERFGKVHKKVVSERARRMKPFETDGDGLRLKPSDDNRDPAVAVLLRQYQRVGTRLGLAARQPQNFESNLRHFLCYLLSKYKNI